MAIGCKRCGNCCTIGEISVDPSLTLKEIEQQIQSKYGNINLDSPKQLQKLLFNDLHLPISVTKPINRQ